MLHNITQKNASTSKGSKLSLGQIVRLEDLSVKFGKQFALKNVELNIDPGEIVFITGVSGAGKTTLLKVLSGELEGSTGQVNRGLGEPFIARVFQDLRLVEDCTCEQNLLFAYDSEIYKSKKEFQHELSELCRILGVQDRLNLPISKANGGLRQKIAIIRALLSRPDVFIADEPTSSLDAENARKLFEVLNLYNIKRGMTIVWATHNKELIKQFTGRIVHLDNGRLVYSGHACFI